MSEFFQKLPMLLVTVHHYSRVQIGYNQVAKLNEDIRILCTYTRPWRALSAGLYFLLSLYALYNFGSKALSTLASLIRLAPMGRSSSERFHASSLPTRVGVMSVMSVNQSTKPSAASARPGLEKINVLKRGQD